MLIKLENNSTGSRFRVNTIITAAVSAGLLFAAIPANAYIARKDTISIEFRASDLDRVDGVQRVYEMMTREATKACHATRAMSLGEKRIAKQCVADLVDDFVVDLNDSRLNKYHETQLAS